MMVGKFDTVYFNRLCAFINNRDNITYKISDLTDDPEKMIDYLKYYIDHRTSDMIEILFLDPEPGQQYTHFRVYEFFDWILYEQQLNRIREQSKYPTMSTTTSTTAPAIPGIKVKDKQKSKIAHNPFSTPSIF